MLVVVVSKKLCWNCSISKNTYNIIFAEEVTHRIKNDVINAVVKAFQIAEEMDASQNIFLQILQYGKEQTTEDFLNPWTLITYVPTHGSQL